MRCGFKNIVGAASLVSTLASPALCSAEKVVYSNRGSGPRGDYIYSDGTGRPQAVQVVVVRDKVGGETGVMEKVGKVLGWLGGASIGFPLAGFFGVTGGVATFFGGGGTLAFPVALVACGGSLFLCVYVGGKIGGFVGRVIGNALS